MRVANDLAENQPGNRKHTNIKPLLHASLWQRFLNNYNVPMKSSKTGTGPKPRAW